MKVKELGEFGVIDRLASLIQRRGAGRTDAFGYKLVVDVGDDTAAWRPGAATELATTDTMVEGVHFSQASIPWYDLGWKVMAANVSDIAAMGGLPLYALVTLGLPPETDVARLDELYGGMLDLAAEYRFRIVGGDMVRSEAVFVTVSLTGATDLAPMLRSSAQAGDQVAVTGFLGLSAAGLKVLQESLDVGAAEERLTAAHRTPRPLVDQGRVLAQESVMADMDVSDGLVDDLGKLIRASGVSARIKAAQVPLEAELVKAFPEECLEMALYGGEDYALVFCAPPPVMARALAKLPGESAVIGELFDSPPGTVSVIDSGGNELTPSRLGWDHYR